MLLAEFSWSLFLTPFGIPIVAIVCTFTWLIFLAVSEAVAKVYCHRADVDLKMELLSRGYSSDEIVRITEAGRDLDSKGGSFGRHHGVATQR